MKHRAQLRICHERIAANPLVHEARRVRPWQFCQLKAHAWCFDCSHYVCAQHLHANHDLHRTEVE